MNNITYIDIRFNNKKEKRSYKLISTGTTKKSEPDDKSFSTCLFIAMRNNRTSASMKTANDLKKINTDFVPAL